jgi:hypothetical protein
MDINVVHSMVGLGFRIGMFGHQHKVQTEPRSVYLSGTETIAIISAGSLCAGERDLPRGFHRQYNVVQVAAEFLSARIHVREMRVANIFGRSAMASQGGQSYTELSWDLPKDMAGRASRPEGRKLEQSILEAERLFKENRMADVTNLLLPSSSSLNPYGRKLLLDAALARDDWAAVRKIASPPKSIAEFVALIEALLKAGNTQGARQAFEIHRSTFNMPDAQIAELESRIAFHELTR